MKTVISGARWFESKRQADRMFQAKAVMVAEQCRTIGRLSGAPYMVENPVSVLASAFGKPQRMLRLLCATRRNHDHRPHQSA